MGDLPLNPRPIDQLLSEFSSGTTDVDAAQGFVGAEVAAQVEQTVLNRSLLRTELRGYQEFGARYAVARERTLLCDDLGLGKTLQALAVAAHLAAAEQPRHTLVVCQPNTGIHWAAETAKTPRCGRSRSAAVNAMRALRIGRIPAAWPSSPTTPCSASNRPNVPRWSSSTRRTCCATRNPTVPAPCATC